MTTTDKTGEKLAASVRRTKENVAQNPEPAAPATTKKAPVKRATAAVKPAAAKAPASKGTTAARKAVPTVAKAPLDDVDLYQGGRRIWPD